MSPLFPDIECMISLEIQQVCGVHLKHKQTLLVCRLLVQTSGSRCVSASATKYNFHAVQYWFGATVWWGKDSYVESGSLK